MTGHLRSHWDNGIKTGGLIEYVKLFAIIGIFVLLLACINFMNLSTARSEKRAREVGVRKAIGSLRKQLISQFFIESLLVVVFAFGFSLFCQSVVSSLVPMRWLIKDAIFHFSSLYLLDNLPWIYTHYCDCLRKLSRALFVFL